MKFEEVEKIILEKTSTKEAVKVDSLADFVWKENDDPELRAIIKDLDKYFKTPMDREGYESVSHLFGYSVASRVRKIFYYEDLDDAPAKSYRNNNGIWFIIVNPALKNGNKKELRAILLHEMAHICCEGNYKNIINRKTGEVIDNRNGHRGVFDTVLKAIKKVYGEKALIEPPDQFHNDEIHVDGNNQVSRKFPKWGSRMGRMDFYQRQADKGKMSCDEGAIRYGQDLKNKKYSSVITEEIKFKKAVAAALIGASKSK